MDEPTFESEVTFRLVIYDSKDYQGEGISSIVDNAEMAFENTIISQLREINIKQFIVKRIG